MPPVSLALLLTLLAAPALGEPPSPLVEEEARTLAQRGKRLPPERRRELEEEVRRKMQTYLTVELSSRLGLDDPRALQLSAALARQGERRQAARRRTRAAYEKLGALLAQKAEPAALERQMQEVRQAREARGAALLRLLDDTKAFLSVEEQARLVLALPEVMGEMKQMMRRSRREHRRERGPSAPSPRR